MTSVAELSPEQLRGETLDLSVGAYCADRGDFNALYDKTMKDIVGHKIVSVELKVCIPTVFHFLVFASLTV